MKPAKQNVHSDVRISMGDLHSMVCTDLNGKEDLAKYLLGVIPYIRGPHDETKLREMNIRYLQWLDTSELVIAAEIKERISSALSHARKNISTKPGPSPCVNCGGDGDACFKDERSGDSICNQCGAAWPDTNAPTLNKYYIPECTTVITHFAYKRVNHFREWLNQLQAKESADISGVVELVEVELKKERTTEVTPAKVRRALKKLRMGKHYERVHRIVYIISGTDPPVLSSQLEEKLIEMFRSIQSPFDKHAPKKRKNFLSYSYTINKLFGILGISEMQCHFPLLKSREKLYEQDKTWKCICSDLSWPFYPSL